MSFNSNPPLFALCCTAADGPKRLGRHRYGSSTFRNLTDGQFIEKTVSLSGKTEIVDGKCNVVFDIPRLGDIVHTFALDVDSSGGSPDSLFGRYELCDVPSDPTASGRYKEGMTLKVNNTLARAAGLTVTNMSIPLMIRETVDFRNCYIPMIASFDTVSNIILYGVVNPEVAKCIYLHVDYVYFNTPERIHLARNLGESPMAICNYVTQEIETSDSKCRIGNNMGTWSSLTGRRIPDVINPIMEVNTVTGLIIKPKSIDSPIYSVDVDVNLHNFCSWDLRTADAAWEKVGLKNPHDGSILLPFSRNMWEMPEKAGFLDLSRVDKLDLKIVGAPNVKYDITALGYTTRFLSGRQLVSVI